MNPRKQPTTSDQPPVGAHTVHSTDHRHAAPHPLPHPLPHTLPRPLPLALAAAVCLGTLAAGCSTAGIERRVERDHAPGASAAAAITGGPPLVAFPAPAASATGAAAGAAAAAASAAAESDARPAAVGTREDAHRRAAEQLAAPVLRRSAAAWVAGTSVPIARSDTEPQPLILSEPVRLAFADRVPLRQMAERLSNITGLAVRIKADAEPPASRTGSALLGPSGGPANPVNSPSSALASAPTPGHTPGHPPGNATAIQSVAMNWEGPLAGYLDHVTDSLGLSWEWRDGAIVIERLRTEAFSLAAFEGVTDFAMSMAGADAATSGVTPGANSGASASTAAAEVKEKSQANPVASVIASVRQIIANVPGSEVIRADGSGRLLVTTSKEAMARVRDFLRAENAAMNRQVQLQIDIYSVRRSESDQRGVDWEVVMSAVSRALGMTVASPATLVGTGAASVGWSILDAARAPGSNTARRWAGSSAILQMLNQQGTTTEYRPVSLIGRHRQWMRSASLATKAYVSETTPATGSLTGSGAPGLKTAQVTFGDRYIAQAAVLDDAQILLKFGLGLSSLVGITKESSGTGALQQTVQTPETSSIVDQREVLLRPGQVLAITGLSRVVTSEDARTLDEQAPMVMGGSRRLSRQREDFVIFVRPTVL